MRGKDNWNPSDTELKELENMNEMSKSKSRTHTRTSHMYSVNSRGFSAHDDIMDDDMMDDYISPGGTSDVEFWMPHYVVGAYSSHA